MTNFRAQKNLVDEIKSAEFSNENSAQLHSFILVSSKYYRDRDANSFNFVLATRHDDETGRKGDNTNSNERQRCWLRNGREQRHATISLRRSADLVAFSAAIGWRRPVEIQLARA